MKPVPTSETAPSASVDDVWLERWLPLLRERTGERCVLELGCGKGRDTAVLHAAGLRVVALDRSSLSLAQARRAVPGASFIESDLRAPLPIEPADVGPATFWWRTKASASSIVRRC